MRATGALRALFARSRLFTRLDDDAFQLFVEALRHQPLAAGDLLFRQGQPGDSMAVVLAGAFRVEVARAGGKREELGTIGPGDVIGEMTCVDPAPRSADVVAMSQAEVLLLDRATLDFLARRNPPIYSAVMGGIIARTTERLAETSTRVEAALVQLGVAPTAPHMPSLPEMGDAPRAPAPHEEPRRLRKLAGLKGFNEAELGMLVRVATPRDFAPGERLFEEGQPGGSCMVITAGEVEVSRRVDGRIRRLATLPAGSIAGQIALVHTGIRQATVTAVEPVTALELSRYNFEKLLAAQAPLAIRFQEQVAAASIRQLRLVNQRLGTVLDRVDDLRAGPPPEPELHDAPTAPELQAPVGFDPPIEAVEVTRPTYASPAATPHDDEFVDVEWSPDAPPETHDFDLPEPTGSHRAHAATSAPSIDLDDWATQPDARPTRPAPAPASPPPTASQPRAPRAGGSSIPRRPVDLNRSDDDARSTMAFIQAALSEWGMRVEDLDGMKTKVPEGHISRQEALLRERR